MSETMSAMIETQLRDMTEQYRKSLREQFKGQGWKTHSMTDQEHRVWFEAMVSGNKKLKIVGNPNWSIALEFVPGGMREISRYERTVGLNKGAENGNS